MSWPLACWHTSLKWSGIHFYGLITICWRTKCVLPLHTAAWSPTSRPPPPLNMNHMSELLLLWSLPEVKYSNHICKYVSYGKQMVCAAVKTMQGSKVQFYLGTHIDKSMLDWLIDWLMDSSLVFWRHSSMRTRLKTTDGLVQTNVVCSLWPLQKSHIWLIIYN